MVHNSDITVQGISVVSFENFSFHMKRPMIMISHDSGFSRILNYFQLTRKAFRKNQYSLVEKVYIVLQEDTRK